MPQNYPGGGHYNTMQQQPPQQQPQQQQQQQPSRMMDSSMGVNMMPQGYNQSYQGAPAGGGSTIMQGGQQPGYMQQPQSQYNPQSQRSVFLGWGMWIVHFRGKVEFVEGQVMLHGSGENSQAIQALSLSHQILSYKFDHYVTCHDIVQYHPWFTSYQPSFQISLHPIATLV